MRRIGRWMLNGVTVLSLALCVGTCVLWARSYWVADSYSRADAGWYLDLMQSRGSLAVTRTRFPPINGLPASQANKRPTFVPPVYKTTAPISLRARQWTRALPGMAPDPGFRSGHFWPGIAWVISQGGTAFGAATPDPRMPGVFISSPTYPQRRYFYVNHWLVAGLLSVLPVIWVVRRYRGRLRVAGHCVKCSYDLTGNISGVCPECGMKIAEAK